MKCEKEIGWIILIITVSACVIFTFDGENYHKEPNYGPRCIGSPNGPSYNEELGKNQTFMLFSTNEFLTAPATGIGY